MKTNDRTRRGFLKSAALAAGAGLLPAQALWAAEKGICFGLCADVHKDLMPDADERLGKFIAKANAENLDFIVQMGDFCCPHEKNQGFLDIFKKFKGPRYHVLGNHDTDGGFTREQTLAFWRAPLKYYSFDAGGFHFVVLDGNEQKEGAAPGYPRCIGKRQLDWLNADLTRTPLQSFLFSHQSLENPDGLENGSEVRAALEAVNAQAGFTKVVACFSGHHHIDYATRIGGILYIQVNSMSYQWLGENYRHARYSPEIEKAFPHVSYTAPYRDALYMLVAIDPAGAIQIRGVQSEYMPPSPSELGYPEGKEGNKASPSIADATLTFTAKP